MVTHRFRGHAAAAGVVLASLLLARVVAADPLAAFVIPAEPNPQSLAANADARPIAPDAPRLTARDGHFYAGPQRVRFWAVNLTFAACFPTHDEAAALAFRLAQAGVNCVRLHHMDISTWDHGGIWDAHDPRKLSPEALDRLDDLLDQLARNGIYVDLNLHVSRTHSRYVGLPSVPALPFDKMIDLFTPQLIAAQQDYARQLLGHVGRYRGLRLADDPVIALVEISNEDSLFMWGAPQNLQNLPAPYAAILRNQFGAWLKARYGSTENLRAAWGRGALPLGRNLLADQDFKALRAGAVEAWPLEVHPGNTARITPGDEAGAVRVEITQADPTNWHIQFQQPKLALQAGAYYTVSFQARADARRTIDYAVNQAHEPWQGLGLGASAGLTTEWHTFRTGFVATLNDRQARLSFIVGGHPGAVEFKAARLCPGGQEGLADDETLERDNVALFGGGETVARTQDRWRFLAETDKHFWDTMYGLIKRDLGCKALVTGTIVFGPLGLYGQSGMDFIDAHAYWHHPNFPGRPWDAENWTVEQQAMVDHPEGATLPGLACARLAGKPFTVTEYNHPAPNDYQAECVPELASFAAAQDWDGVWLFDYGAAADHFRGFFDVASNSAKWGFMGAGAAIFRAGGIEPLGLGKSIPLAAAGDLWPALALAQQRHGSAMLAVLADATPPGKLRWTDLLSERIYASLSPVLQPDSSPARATRIRWEPAAGGGEYSYEAVGSGAWVWVGHAGSGAGDTALVRLDRPRFAAITVTCMDGLPFEKTARVLVAACGRCENTGMEFTPDRRSVGRHWGAGPVCIEAVDAAVRLPPALRRGNWRVQVLAADGSAVGAPEKLLLTDDGQFHLKAADRTMWHLLTRE